VLFNRHRLSIDRDIEGSFRGPKQAREDDKKPEIRGLRKKPDHQHITDRRIPNYAPAAVTSDELSCYGHADDRADNDTDQHKGERSVLDIKGLLEYRHVGRPGSKACSIREKEHCERPFWPLHLCIGTVHCDSLLLFRLQVLYHSVQYAIRTTLITFRNGS
jgi:hypothetical protein